MLRGFLPNEDLICLLGGGRRGCCCLLRGSNGGNLSALALCEL
ncbi:hypothetical protein PAMC26577_29515 [Caballeronia sordidicola]|uniref:Uncharacterized protein n=1 Tax=Caballeronia sordidicola TaxID=196367 RepID=A0A242MEZ9_CABSO|nr:hypothetical protein PAMC26577_29515 [Caballeronia sordidicola]